MRYFLTLCLVSIFLAACNPANTQPPVEVVPAITFTPIPTLTSTVVPTSTPAAPLGNIALDFIALLCNADWMNGGQNLKTCPDVNADHSGGLAMVVDPASMELPFDTAVLLTIPSWNGFNSLFLRYPSFTVAPNDRFRALLACDPAWPCDVQFALEYYDTKGTFHGPFLAWNYKTGDSPINVDSELRALAGQTVDFVLVIRLFHAIDNPHQDNGLWITPHIYRPIQ